MFFVKLDFDLTIFSPKCLVLLDRGLVILKRVSIFLKRSSSILRKGSFISRRRMFASNGSALLACCYFPLRTKRLKPNATEIEIPGFIRPTSTVSLSILRRSSSVFRRSRCLFESNGFVKLACLIISHGRKRLKLVSKYKPLRFIRPRLTVSKLW